MEYMQYLLHNSKNYPKSFKNYRELKVKTKGELFTKILALMCKYGDD